MRYINRIFKIISVCLVVALYFLLSHADLGKDVINPDGINWHARTQNFVEAWETGKYDEMYQVYHPGTTIMWISGPILKSFLGENWGSAVEGAKSTFYNRDYYAKLSLVVFSTITFALLLFLMCWIVGLRYALVFGLILTLEPFSIGMRRLYHLDYLMTELLFIAFVLLIYFNYKRSRIVATVFAGIFFALALLTKSTAIIILPVVPFLFFLGNPKWWKKTIGLFVFVLSVCTFLYIFFPPVWHNPLKDFPKYFKRVSSGITDIGVEGKKELGSSGKEENITLDETLDDMGSNFYYASTAIRLSMLGLALVLSGTGLYIYQFFRGVLVSLIKTVKNRRIGTKFIFKNDSWLVFWSLGISLAVLIGLSMATKKTDRYVILVMPFLFTVSAYLLNRLHRFLIALLLFVYIAVISYELRLYHPYYFSYSNPYFGGIKMRIAALDNSEFGVGTNEAFNIVQKDRTLTGNTGYYTISGPKSIKAISAGGRFSRYPSCVTDYVVASYLDDKPTYMCVNDYELLDTVKIANYDYWYVYKRLNQKHESNYE